MFGVPKEHVEEYFQKRGNKNLSSITLFHSLLEELNELSYECFRFAKCDKKAYMPNLISELAHVLICINFICYRLGIEITEEDIYKEVVKKAKQHNMKWIKEKK